jgi:hypothetical protein
MIIFRARRNNDIDLIFNFDMVITIVMSDSKCISEEIV